MNRSLYQWKTSIRDAFSAENTDLLAKLIDLLAKLGGLLAKLKN